uniref:J domain-containing protein n=1 Tax=viral metagenome TaxID=1070528 RepID=A0A6C0H9B5_9ZZZZ
MNLQEALQIMKIDNGFNNLSIDTLKKKYHKLALIHHPDKNGNSIEAKEKFQKLGIAYELLKKELGYMNHDTEMETEDPIFNNPSESNGYSFLLNMFLQNIINGQYSESVKTIIRDIVSGCKDISLKMFDKMDRETSLYIYNFIIKYKDLFHLNDSILTSVRDIILEKFKDIQIFTLNPSIDDLFENNVYKLEYNSKLYFVPLWHGEVYFDVDAMENDIKEIIVKCMPELPDHMCIDENNHLYVNVNIKFSLSLLKEKTTSIFVGKKRYDIPNEELYCKQNQNYIFKNRGISQIDEIDMYNIKKKGDVVIRINFI